MDSKTTILLLAEAAPLKTLPPKEQQLHSMQHHKTYSYNCFADLFWGHVLHHGLSHPHHLRTHHDGDLWRNSKSGQSLLDLSLHGSLRGKGSCRQEEEQVQGRQPFSVPRLNALLHNCVSMICRGVSFCPLLAWPLCSMSCHGRWLSRSAWAGMLLLSASSSQESSCCLSVLWPVFPSEVRPV